MISLGRNLKKIIKFEKSENRKLQPKATSSNGEKDEGYRIPLIKEDESHQTKLSSPLNEVKKRKKKTMTVV